MKPLLITLLLIGAFMVNGVALAQDDLEQQDNAEIEPSSFGDAGSFHGALTPYGEWLELRDGFYAWRPTHVGPSWRPYLYGHWAWTDYGWYWVSNEPFGWATFHYGRWYYDDYYGWIWIPDRTWGPAWVEWRYNDDYLGWAPLPPYATFGISFGIRFTSRWFAPYHYWSFVHYRHFTSPYVVREVVSYGETRRLIGVTRSGGRYDYDGSHIINRGIDRGFIERRGGYTRIPRTDVRVTGTVGERVVRDRNQERIEVYRPNQPYTGRSNERFEARTIDRPTSLEFHRIERVPRDATVMTAPRTSDRDRRPGEQAVRPPTSRIERPTTTPPRTENRAPLLRSDQYRRQQERQTYFPDRNRSTTFENRSNAQPPRREQRAITPERYQGGGRQQSVAPQPRREENRSAPADRREAPRRESGRKRG